MSTAGDRPKLKIRVGNRASLDSQSAEAPSAAAPPSSGPRLKIKIQNSSQPSTPAAEENIDPTASAKSTRKYTKKDKSGPDGNPASASKKRGRNVADHETGAPASKKKQSRRLSIADSVVSTAPAAGLAQQTAARPSIPKLRLVRKPAPAPPGGVKLKVLRRGKIPERPLGVGYDSEASDVEVDPAIEEQFVLRMQPGPDCDYLRQAIADRRLGDPVKAGGADVKMKFFNKDGRRAMVSIRGKHYAAVLVDLPCIIESMKSWDKKGWLKSADISQMLLVLGPVQSEEEAKNHPIYTQDIDRSGGGWQYAHGLTPPMQWARKRRFRKRVSHRTIEAVEEEVDRLLAADEEAEKNNNGEASKYEVLDLDRMARERTETEEEDGMYDEDQDAEGEVDESAYSQGQVAEGIENEDDMDAAMLAEIEQGLLAIDDDDPTSNHAIPTADHAVALTDVEAALGEGLTPTTLDQPTLYTTANTPSANQEDSGDGEDEEEDGAIDEIDEDMLEQQQERAQQREEILDLENAIKAKRAEMARVQSTVLKTRLSKDIQGLESDLQIKRAAAGMIVEEE